MAYTSGAYYGRGGAGSPPQGRHPAAGAYDGPRPFGGGAATGGGADPGGASASAFYNHVRSSVHRTDGYGAGGAVPVPASAVGLGELHARLSALSAGHGPAGGDVAPHYPGAGTAAHIPAGSLVGGGLAHAPSTLTPPRGAGGGAAYQPPSSYTHGGGGGGGAAMMSPGGGGGGGGDDGGLTADELAALRVVELDSKVRVSADVSPAAGASPDELSPSKLNLQRLCDDATAKVFPKHVVFSRANGSPVVEIVIAELFELTEDDARHSLTFFLQRTSGVAVIEVVCANAAARGALYKIVCGKRNQLAG